MPTNFIFVESIQKIIKNGEHEIKISKGTKISPAAFDLIKEKQIKVICEEKSLSETDKVTEPTIDSTKKNDSRNHDTQVDPSAKIIKNALKQMSEVTEEDVDQITQRVIERLTELKSCDH